MTKVVVIGLDGTTFKLLDPLLERGLLPHLKKIIDRGARARLLSTKPPVTVPAWTTFATGVHPGKHGCYDFFLPGKNIRDFRPATSRDIRVPTLYELLEQAGKKSIIINLPNSYPPRLPNMTMITDFMTYGDEFIFPRELKEKYSVLQRYRLAPDERIKLTKDLPTYIQHIINLEKDRVAAVKELFSNEPWDFFFFLFSSTDWVSHLVFNEMIEQQRADALAVFKLVDDFFGWLEEHLPADTTLYVMSDHGFTYYTELFYINRWLEQEGYLTTTSGSGKFEEAATARRRSLTAARKKKKLRLQVNKKMLSLLFFHPSIERAVKWLYHRLKRVVPLAVSVDIGIDLDKTKVCFPRGSMLQTLYLNYQGNFSEGLITDKAEYDRIRADVKTKLEALRTPSSKRVTEHVYTKEELYGATPPVPSPDLHCATKDVWIVGHLHSKSVFEKAISNKHDEFGIFIATGNDIQAGKHLPDASIADIMPTILHQFGLTVPAYVDGKVLTDIFDPTSATAKVEQKISSANKNEKERLNDLLDELAI